MSRPGSGWNRHLREWSVALAYLVLLVLLAFLAPAFYKPDYLRGLLVSKSTVLIAAVGMTLVIVARQIDISVGSQFSVCGVIAGLLAQSGLPMPLVAPLRQLRLRPRAGVTYARNATSGLLVRPD